jgi:hypothetical protein
VIREMQCSDWSALSDRATPGLIIELALPIPVNCAWAEREREIKKHELLK